MAAPITCLVYGTVRYPDNTPAVGNDMEFFVTPQNALPQFSQGDLLSGKCALFTTDEDGYFEMPLMIGSLVTLHVKQTNFQCQFVVPDAIDADIENIPGVLGVLRPVENPF